MTSSDESQISPPQAKKLVVVFDTSSIFTKSGFYLLNDEAKRLIRDTRAHTSLQITWLLPSVVLGERRYRLKQKVSSLFESVSRVSDLIGRDLPVSEDDMLKALKMRVEQTLKEFAIEVFEPNWAEIDLQQIVAHSVDRTPPFSSGGSEKGFRDTVVLETYLQVLGDPRFTDHYATLMTGDGLLLKAVTKRAEAYDNNLPPGSLEDLRGTIATLAEELELELVNRIVPLAMALFFTPGDLNSIFTRFGIPARIQNEFQSAFSSRPPGADLRNTYPPTIHQSRFVQKEGDRFHWANQIVFPSVAYRITYSVGPTSSSAGSLQTGTYSANLFGEDPDPSSATNIYSSSSGFLLPNPSYVPMSNGRTLFEVVWSAAYAGEAGLTDPLVEDLVYRGTEWD